MSEMALWIAFNLGVLAVLAIDLGVFNKKAHKISVKEAAIWSAIWVALSLVFAGVIFFTMGSSRSAEIQGAGSPSSRVIQALPMPRSA